MELALALQGAQVGAAALAGAALGLFYDVLRALRRRLSRGQWLLDALFALACAYALVRLTLLPGRGQFRLFFLRPARAGGDSGRAGAGFARFDGAFAVGAEKN